jgi:hypothetical protein
MLILGVPVVVAVLIPRQVTGSVALVLPDRATPAVLAIRVLILMRVMVVVVAELGLSVLMAQPVLVVMAELVQHLPSQVPLLQELVVAVGLLGLAPRVVVVLVVVALELLVVLVLLGL